ncbi:MAG: T9SS type A sorting domain-containing protein [Bacteroidia bacterium]|nr:T9SS type A sorting domain-containing protein [Bacteroidia bacterium]
MRALVLLSWLLSSSFALAQTYGSTYGGSSYTQNSYEQTRNYPLSSYTEAEESLCLTCNHCQIPAATINASFPLLLLNFDAERKSVREVQLKWKWLSDSPPSKAMLHFMSPEGKSFQEIMTWKGNVPKEYFHQNDFLSSSWYQLELVDDGGKSHFSRIREVPGKSAVILMELFPNPAKDHVSIVLSGIKEGGYLIRISDISGKQVFMERRAMSSGTPQVIHSLNGLTGGCYLVELRGVEGVFRKKLILHR